MSKVKSYSKKLREKEDKEFKSNFDGSQREWLKLIKTITAMANTKGGIVVLEKVNINLSQLDSAQLDDKVNSYVEPRIHNIVSEKYGKKGIKIIVPNSRLKPHIFKRNGIYSEGDKQKFSFYKGQIWVRHSSKNETVTWDDFQRFIKENLNSFLERINVIAAQYPLKELEISKEGVPFPIKPVEDKKKGIPAVIMKEKIDPNVDYPYQAKDLAKILNKNQAFIVQLLKVLRLKEDPVFSFEVKNSSGKVIMRKYNDKCLERLRKFLAEKPLFNPWHDEI